jgi:hypothetical protein
MGGNPFDQMAQEILKQKQLMDELEAENRELRQQMADLRTGRGIFVDIHGIRFALSGDPAPTQVVPTLSVSSAASPSTATVATPTPPIQQLVDTPTTEIASITSPLQDQDVTEQVAQANYHEDNAPTGEEPTFLEEIMMAEFASALPSVNAVRPDVADKEQSARQELPKSIDEKQKELLRRELMGSFLLE